MGMQYITEPFLELWKKKNWEKEKKEKKKTKDIKG